jgi:aspartyl-tRNA(Asn)/glutamyl-tRNA(Gln) amidotransferase subunit C
MPRKWEEVTGYTLASEQGAYFRANSARRQPLSGIKTLIVDDAKMSAKVTVEEVRRVAELAHLELAHDETGSMLTDLNAILDYVAELNQLDTSGVEPLAQVSELGNAVGASAPRVDQLRPSLDRAAVMPEAPDSDQVFFKVPKVIER